MVEMAVSLLVRILEVGETSSMATVQTLVQTHSNKAYLDRVGEDKAYRNRVGKLISMTEMDRNLGVVIAKALGWWRNSILIAMRN